MNTWLHRIGLPWAWALLPIVSGGFAPADGQGSDQPTPPPQAYLRAAAEAGDPAAQTRLADFYAGSQDSANAVVWYRKAAETGHAQAQWQLGRYYDFGADPIPVDRTVAMSWYTRSAAHGCVNAQLDLGQIFERGVTGQPDFVESYKWYSIASANKSLLAKMSCDQLARKLSASELEEARRRVEVFKATQSDSAPTDSEQAQPEKVVHPVAVTPRPEPVAPPAVAVAKQPIQEPTDLPHKAAPSPDPAIAKQGSKETIGRVEVFATIPPISAPVVSPPPREKVVRPVLATSPPKPVAPPAVAVAKPQVQEPSSLPTKVVPPPNPAIAAKLQLKGISSFGTRRVASINNRNLFNGEEASLATDGQPMRVRCLEIKSSSAIVLVDGSPGPIELKLTR